MKPDDFRWHVAARQPPGTSDTSRFATDHINNPNAINTIFNLASRPTEPGAACATARCCQVHHILKDGADSVGVAGASLRVYVNIGMCGDYWMTRHDPVLGIANRQQPFEMDHARQELRGLAAHRSADGERRELPQAMKPLAAEGRAGRRRLPDAHQPTRCRTRPSGLRRELRVVPLEQAAARRARPIRAPWFRDGGRERRTSSTDNFLSDDKRYPVIRLGTNIARALGSNATRGNIWDQFSSETYKELPGVGTLHEPLQPARPEQADHASRCRAAAAATTARRR